MPAERAFRGTTLGSSNSGLGDQPCPSSDAFLRRRRRHEAKPRMPKAATAIARITTMKATSIMTKVYHAA